MNRRQFLSHSLLSASAVVVATGCNNSATPEPPDRKHLRSLLPRKILAKIDEQNATNLNSFNSNIQAITMNDYRSDNVVWVNSSLYAYIELRP